MRRELIDSVNVVVGFVVRTRKEANGAFNQVELIAVGVHFGRVKNRVSEVVHEIVVGIVSFGAVDYDRLQVFVPAVRLAEKLAQSAFAINGVLSETFDEFFGNIFVNVVGIGMAEIILKRRLLTTNILPTTAIPTYIRWNKETLLV